MNTNPKLRLRVVATRIQPDEIQLQDHITFDYGNPNTHPPTRVGKVIDFRGGCVLVWDYSLCDGPGPRNYKMNLLRGLSRLDEVECTVLAETPFKRFMTALESFRRKFGRGESSDISKPD